MRYLSETKIIGEGYRDFWNFKGRYRVCKGSRASKKSKTTALWIIYFMMKYPKANTLVVRKVFRTLKDSCFAELKWAISRWQLENFWDVKYSPLEITRKDTGQKIYFRGADDPLKITSITVTHGFLCWAWLEEAYELSNEADFDILDESIRGDVGENLWKMWTITFNPWNEKHWLNKRFFNSNDSANILAKTTTYKCNEWLDDSDYRLFETMRINNPKRYEVAGLGNWGVVEGAIYENWEELFFDVNKLSGTKVFGLDFGYTNDPTALFCGVVDNKNMEIYVFDELYQKKLSNKQIYDKIKFSGYDKEKITADSAEPKSIDELRSLGLKNIKPARKGKDSVNSGIQFIQNYKIIIHPRCVNFLTEINNYTWQEDKFGGKLNKPVDDFNHLLDAMRYALEDIMRGNVFSFS
jgi:phage terminase large subunit